MLDDLVNQELQSILPTTHPKVLMFSMHCEAMHESVIWKFFNVSIHLVFFMILGFMCFSAIFPQHLFRFLQVRQLDCTVLLFEMMPLAFGCHEL